MTIELLAKKVREMRYMAEMELMLSSEPEEADSGKDPGMIIPTCFQ